MAVAVRVKFAPALTVVPAPVPLLFALEVTVKLDGRRLKLSVEQPVAPVPACVTRTRALRTAVAGAVIATLILPAAQPTGPVTVVAAPTVGHPDQQLVAALNAPGVPVASSTLIVSVLVEGA